MAALSPASLAVFAVALGGLLRWYRFNALSLWVDEGLTVMHARLPWPVLLGFGRIYDPHPTGDAKLVLAPLAGWGYVRLLHTYYFYPLYLDLYARPTARLGRDVAVNGTCMGPDAHAVGWRLSRGRVALLPDGAGGRELRLPTGPDGQGAMLTIRARPGNLYTLRLAARSRLASGFAPAYLSCLSDRGTLLAIAPDGRGAVTPNDGRWHPITITALCPTATSALRIDLRHSGSGQAYFRTLTVHAIAPVEP